MPAETTTGIPEVWSDLHQDLRTDASGRIRKVVNAEAVKTSIDNILRTRYGQRVMRPDFGSGLDDLVFSLMGNHLGDAIIKEVRESIERWEDRVDIKSVDVFQSQDQNFVRIDLKFSIYGYEDIFEMNVSL